MLTKLFSLIRPNDPRIVELENLLAATEKDLEWQKEAVEISTSSHANSLNEIDRLNKKVRVLSGQVIEATNKGIKIGEQATRAEKEAKSVGQRYHEALSLNSEWAGRYAKANSDAGELSDMLVESQAKVTRLEAIDKANGSVIKRQCDAIDDINKRLLAAQDEASRTIEQMTRAEANTRKFERLYETSRVSLEDNQHRIVLAVAALTRDLPAKPTSVEDEAFSLN